MVWLNTLSTASRRKWSGHDSWRWGENRSDRSHTASCSLSQQLTCLMDGDFDVHGAVATLMSMCGRAVKVELPSDSDEKPSPFNYEGPPRDWLLLCQSLSCLVATCAICLSVWATAEWQVPSENMAHNVNARQACGLRKDCSCPSLFPTSSLTVKADMMALSSPKNLFADISSLCDTAERSWVNDGLR